MSTTYTKIERPLTTGPSHAVTSRSLSMTINPVLGELAAELRAETRQLLHLWSLDETTTDAAELAVSELYSNVVRHVRRGPCVITLGLEATLLRLTVIDCGLRMPEIPPDPYAYVVEIQGESGRGLCMVALAADRMYFERAHAGTGKAAVVEWSVAA